MEQLKNLVGRTVRVWAYVQEDRERLRRIVGRIIKTTPSTLTLEHLDNPRATLTIPVDKTMCIREWERRFWSRAWNAEGRILWGNAVVFKRRGLELKSRGPAVYFINGAFFVLGAALLAFSFLQIVSTVHSLTSSLLEIGSPLSNPIVNQTAINILGNASREIGPGAIVGPLNPTGMGVPTNLLTAYGWHYLAVAWASVAALLAYVFVMLGGFFFMFVDLGSGLLCDQYYERNLTDYKDMRFGDEVK